MELRVALCYCVVLLLALLFITFSRSKNFCLRYPPSRPLALPVIGHLHLLCQSIHRTLAAISTHHSPLLLLSFGSHPVLLVSSPATAEDCLTINDVTFANHPRLLYSKYFGYDHTSLSDSSYGPQRNLR